MSGVMAIVRKEIRESRKNPTFLRVLITGGLILPAVYGGIAGAEILRGGPRAFEAVRAFLPLYTLFVGLLPALGSLTLSLESFVGEKERRTLEPLLAAPVTDREVFLGKFIWSLIPPVLLAYGGLFLFFGVIAGAASRGGVPTGRILSLAAEMLPPVAVLVFLAAAFAVGVAVIISMRSTTVKGAAAFSSLLVLPIILLAIWKGPAILAPGSPGRTTVFFGLLALDIVLVRVGARLFDRDRLIAGL